MWNTLAQVTVVVVLALCTAELGWSASPATTGSDTAVLTRAAGQIEKGDARKGAEEIRDSGILISEKCPAFVRSQARALYAVAQSLDGHCDAALETTRSWQPMDPQDVQLKDLVWPLLRSAIVQSGRTVLCDVILKGNGWLSVDVESLRQCLGDFEGEIALVLRSNTPPSAGMGKTVKVAAQKGREVIPFWAGEISVEAKTTPSGTTAQAKAVLESWNPTPVSLVFAKVPDRPRLEYDTTTQELKWTEPAEHKRQRKLLRMQVIQTDNRRLVFTRDVNLETSVSLAEMNKNIVPPKIDPVKYQYEAQLYPLDENGHPSGHMITATFGLGSTNGKAKSNEPAVGK